MLLYFDFMNSSIVALSGIFYLAFNCSTIGFKVFSAIILPKDIVFLSSLRAVSISLQKLCSSLYNKWSLSSLYRFLANSANAFESETVMMAPASGFYSDPELGRHQVRLAYVLSRDKIRRALYILGKALEKYNS